jgi:hypothetical protein
MKTNPELLNRTRNIVTFNGNKVKCFPSTFGSHNGEPICTGEIMEGESEGKWTSVTGEAARIGCNKTKVSADDLKRKQIRLLNDITNKRMGGTRRRW